MVKHLHQPDWLVQHPASNGELNSVVNYLMNAFPAIYNSSPWRISRRAPLIGEHNTEIFCDELGLSRGELSVLAESRVV